MKINLFGFEIYIHRIPQKKYTPDELLVIKMTREQLRRKVTGAIKNACDAHPEIPKTFIGSISKRVMGIIVNTNGIPEYMIKGNYIR